MTYDMHTYSVDTRSPFQLGPEFALSAGAVPLTVTTDREVVMQALLLYLKCCSVQCGKHMHWLEVM